MSNFATVENMTTIMQGISTAISNAGGSSGVQTIQINGTAQTNNNGVVNLPAYPTTLPASDTTSTYSANGTAPVNGTAVASAINALDVSTVGGSGKYIQSISETNGKISATAVNMPSIPTVLSTSISVTAANWTGASAPYTQTVNVTGMLATDTPFLDIVVSDTTTDGLAQIEAWGLVSKATTAAGTITFKCYEEKPTVDLTVNVKVVR